jgi:hypothetical protein
MEVEYKKAFSAVVCLSVEPDSSHVTCFVIRRMLLVLKDEKATKS